VRDEITRESKIRNETIEEINRRLEVKEREDTYLETKNTLWKLFPVVNL